ncbi:MAG: class I SAM-dependent methyltransferase, partial [Armatimonadetes bacterium]|nr:class I SAM-dependent methyltransferase [Armatimonadota bacterium]
DESPQCASAYTAQEDRTREYARKILKSINHIGGGKKLLDVGCSIGIVVEEASHAGFESQGIDLDSNAIEIGKSRGRDVHLSSLETWPTRDYDWICLSHTLEHIPQPVEFLQKCGVHLKPGGHIIVIVPCYRGLHPQIFGRRWYGWLPRQHFFHYSAPALRQLFQKAGLEPIRVWQESLDHRMQRKYLRNWKDVVKGLASYGVATVGALIGRGDQLVGIARWPENSTQTERAKAL